MRGKSLFVLLAAAPFVVLAAGFIGSDRAGQPAGPAMPAADEEAIAPATLGDPVGGLTDEEEDLFIRGRRLFRWELWRPDRGVKAFNETECSACHREPFFGGSNYDATTYAPFVADSSNATGFRPFQRRQRESGASFAKVAIPEGADLRRAPSLFGIGLIEAIPDSTILAKADPADANKDGISGRALTISGKLGRFGWKGHVATVRDFTIDAFKTELGMNISSFERQDFGGGLGSSQVDAVTHFLKTLGHPKRKAEADSGKARNLFTKIGCASCHTPNFSTGDSPIGGLKKKSIWPYADFLLHEMGSASLHKGSGTPNSTEFRTPPLWGIGKYSGPYWHDGSVKTLAEAIEKHGGEARAAAEAFGKLGKADQDAVISFVKAL
jgi:CxxC motif-containing protein (DUF1111 family)